MEPSRCRTFLAAAEHGSFAKAAAELNYTPSGVSQLIAALEKELGFPLFARRRKGVALTEEGKQMLPAIRAFIQQEQSVYQAAAEIRGLAVGEIVIATYSSISTHWLPQVIRQFRADYPHIRIKLREGIRQEVVQCLEESRADLGFLSCGSDLAYDWIPLAADRMLAVLPREHPLAGSDSYPLLRCADEDFIMPGFGRDDDVAALFERFRIRPNIVFSTQENYAAISMIENGLGMSVMNELITRSWQSGAVLLPLDPPQSITLGIAVPSLENAAPAVRKFIEYAVRMLGREPAGPA
ncbi:MAG: LysR family transcriptional regulator [Firmicutes bacterium]|nr:LysR family transcriptional regulator [Bacillota bacterium]